MKNIVGTIAALFTVFVLLTSAARAVDYPHNTANGYTCASCHQSHSTLGTQGYTNLCLTCHNPADGKAGNKAFVPGDASNPFGNATSARPGTIYQSSHNWSGSDNVPPAGALPPLNPQMTKDNMRGTISCVRCHNVKNPRSSAFNSAPFLRALNDHDEMCLDCHRQRNSSSHLSGTHPVTVSYSGAAKARSAAFQAVPVNSNPGNPSSALILVGGEVLCSTCHRVHFADSNSATYDSATSARQGHLTPSSGRLLRTDLRGASAAALNICSNCHTGKASHNNKGQNVQCADCHSGHVAYDAQAATDEEKRPNVYLIRRYMNISSSAGAVRNGRVFFQYTGSAKNYVDSKGTGVCQGCHAIPQGAGYPIEHASTDPNVCAACHDHQSTYGSFTANCGFCHGFPPPVAAAGYVGVNETTSPHRRHAGGGVNYQYSCSECHKGNSHNTNTFQDVFRDTSAILAGSSARYDTTNRTCANVYCHSPGNKTSSFDPPNNPAVWGGTLTCNGCHKDGAGDPMVSGSHLIHLRYGYGCVVCHADTVSGNTSIKDHSKHVTGSINVAFAAPFSAMVWNSALKTCNGACHSDGRGGAPQYNPTWGEPNTHGCGFCHAMPPASGAHLKHMPLPVNYGLLHQSYTSAGVWSTSADYAFGCANCHPQNATYHVNGSIDLSLDATEGGQIKAKNRSNSQYSGYSQTTGISVVCSASYCHGGSTDSFSYISIGGDGNPVPVTVTIHSTPQVAVSPDWYGGSYIGNRCAMCHGNPPTGGTWHSGFHASSNPSASTNQCQLCHSDATSTDGHGTLIKNKAVHLNGAIDVAPAWTSSCFGCH